MARVRRLTTDLMAIAPAVLLGALLAASIADRWSWFPTAESRVILRHGCLGVCRTRLTPAFPGSSQLGRELQRVVFMAEQERATWVPRWAFTRRGWSVVVPLWIPLAVAGSAAAWSLRPGAAGAERCKACAYDLRGLPRGAPCPECGETAVAR